MRAELIVADTNILLSFIIRPDGFVGGVLDWMLENRQLVFSQETFDEFDTRLWRPKFDRYVTIEERKSFLNDFKMNAAWVTIPGDFKLSCDPDDDKFIETALVAGAPVLVSGDSDLLDLQVDSLEIMTPRGFYERFVVDSDEPRIHESSGCYAVGAGDER